MKDKVLLAALLAGFLLPTTFAAAPELKYAVILARHGVRSPTWDLDRLNQYSVEPWPDFGVRPGELTPRGRDLIKILGAYYRQRFNGQNLLNSGGCADGRRVYIWADIDQRALETGRAFAESILPGCGVPIHSRPEGEKDSVFAGVSRPDTDRAIQAVRERLGPDPQNLLADSRSAVRTLQFILTGGARARMFIESPERVEVIANERAIELRGPLAAGSTLSEDLLLEYADGMQGARLGWGRLSRENLLQILELHRVYADLMRRTPYLARVRGSDLMARILMSMEQAASGKRVEGALGTPDTALLILSGHDTNQANIAGMLGLSWSLPGYPRDETPPGGALMFSLWLNPSRRPREGDYFVRVEYVASSLDQMRDLRRLTLETPPLTQQISMPGCGAGAQGTDCAWEHFRTMLKASIDTSKVDFEVH